MSPSDISFLKLFCVPHFLVINIRYDGFSDVRLEQVRAVLLCQICDTAQVVQRNALGDMSVDILQHELHIFIV